MPWRITGCRCSVSPGYQGSGWGEMASAVVQKRAKTISASECRNGCEANEMMRGTQISGANGWTRTTVMERSDAICRRWKTSRARAALGRRRWVVGKKYDRMILARVSAPIRNAQGQKGSRKGEDRAGEA